MGAYLSTPALEKRSAHGACTRFRWGVSAMQGWRRTMEDEHVVACGDEVGGGDEAAVFAVFDGHGGSEVAKFCQVHRQLAICQAGKRQPMGCS